MLNLAKLDAREGEVESMMNRLETAVEEHPDALQPRVVLARAYLATNRPEQVAVVFSGLDDTEKSVPAVLNEMARVRVQRYFIIRWRWPRRACRTSAAWKKS